MSFEGLVDILAGVAARADAEQFTIRWVGVRDDWVSIGDYIVTIEVFREDLQLRHEFLIRSNGKYVSNQSEVSLRSKVRSRYRRYVVSMGRRLNRMQPDSDGLYRRMIYDDCKTSTFVQCAEDVRELPEAVLSPAHHEGGQG